MITDDAPAQKQLDWAAGYGVCDSCGLDDPKIQKFKGFGKQVDNAAGIIRWYYTNTDKTIIKQKDTPIRIDDEDVTPQNWATAFYIPTPRIFTATATSGAFGKPGSARYSQTAPSLNPRKAATTGF